MPDLLNALVDHLSGAGVVRAPETAGAEPPLWRAPAGGAPAPGEPKGTGNDPTTILSAYYDGDLPPGPGEGYSSRRTVTLRIRTKDPRVVAGLVAAIDAELAPPPYGVRYDWTMGDQPLIESRRWRALGLVGVDQAQGHDYTLGYLFEILA